MRLFIAINFDGPTRERLLALQRKLRNCASGNFTRPENLHLTVAFLGEAEDICAIGRVVSGCFREPVTLLFDRVGTFRRDLYWVGARQDPRLAALYSALVDGLRRAGFTGDWPDRLTPHVTLAREVALASQPDLSFEPFSMTVRRLSLMKSERVGDRLTYSEVFGKDA